MRGTQQEFSRELGDGISVHHVKDTSVCLDGGAIVSVNKEHTIWQYCDGGSSKLLLKFYFNKIIVNFTNVKREENMQMLPLVPVFDFGLLLDYHVFSCPVLTRKG